MFNHCNDDTFQFGLNGILLNDIQLTVGASCALSIILVHLLCCITPKPLQTSSNGALRETILASEWNVLKIMVLSNFFYSENKII